MMNMKVTTRNLANLDAAPEIMVIDPQDSFQHRWMVKHIWWAWRTNHTVHIEATKDEVTFEDRRY